jgi:alpha-mannosidase
MLNRARDLEKQKIFPQVRHSTVSEYLSQFKKKNLKALPIWKDELYLEYHRGTYTTQAETKRFNRKSEVLLSNAEKLSSLASLFGGNYPHQDLKKAWEKVLLNQFHDILPGSSINPVYRDAKESYLEAQSLAKQALIEGLKHIARKIDTAGEEKGIPLLIFNSLSWERDGIVKVILPQNFQGELKVFDDKGREVPSQILSSHKREEILCFLAKKIPAMGYKVYRIQKGSRANYQTSLKTSDTVLENQYFQVTLNPESGNIVSIFDKLQKREVLAPGSSGNQLQLFEDIPNQYDAWEIKYTGRLWELDKAQKIEIANQGPVMASLKVQKNFLGLSKARREPTSDFPSSFFTQEIILYEGIPRIDVQMNADWWEDHVLLKVAFPVDIKSKKATYEIPFAFIERPTTRNTDWESARYEVPAIRWADISEGRYGVSLINESKYGYDIKDNVMRLTLLRSPLSPDPMADRGKHRFSYALYPHKGDWREAKTVQKGYEFNYPLLTLFLDFHPGELPTSYSFFKSSAQNIVLATVKKAEEGDSLLLRFYESEGKLTEAQIELFRKPKKVYELDLMENRLRSINFKDHTLPLNFGKSEIKTLEIIFQD